MHVVRGYNNADKQLVFEREVRAPLPILPGCRGSSGDNPRHTSTGAKVPNSSGAADWSATLERMMPGETFSTRSPGHESGTQGPTSVSSCRTPAPHVHEAVIFSCFDVLYGKTVRLFCGPAVRDELVATAFSLHKSCKAPHVERHDTSIHSILS